MEKPLKSTTLSIIQGLFFVNAGIWLILSAYTLLRLTAKYPGDQIAYVIIGVMMLGNAAAMLLSGWGLSQAPRLAFPFGFLVLLVNIPLTLTDEFGLVDLVTLILDLVLLGMLVVNRKRFYSKSKQEL
jgi:hypothetical protein